MSEGTSPSGRN